MKHDYTDEEIKTAWRDSLSLRAFLAALPERPQAAEIASFKAALAESEKQFQDKVYEIACLLDERDKAQGILKACLSAMPFGNIETHTVENLPHRIADLASEIASLSLENERLEAEIAAMRQPLLADDGNAIQKIKFPDQEIETWEESAEVHDMLEAAAQAAAQAVAAVVLAQAVRRMEAVPLVELHSAYWAGRNPVCHNDALNRVRARLIAAAKGEGQAQPIVVNEPPYDEEPAWTPAVGDTVRLKSGGPAMVVTHVDPLSLMCAWMNANNELQVEPITTLCLTQVPNP